ncbi:ABC transporter ATP-binding protein [Hymenobacter lutimineralis]|uniref:ABC transporter ATP-binding protein n=1 Tax=Hymenobacter lutimineralis TaxID=2606448 RepID=A0A5D6VGU6_9BACT|nr:ABC transporter ATP-binding protein [Hymenobacter lutimineralis]TYZ14322.1 ABC transporter ATP-binding protein [Hymenobacter lutimineralis]
MSASVVLSVQGLSKKFSRHLRTALWYGLLDIGSELWPRAKAAATGLRRHEFWSLQDVTFELRAGEALAILGTNGAGKSTLLKMLNGLMKPDAGRIQVRGRVGALIELGVGLDPTLSGRENIFVRAALLGFTRSQVLPLLPEIIAFTELGDAIEMPVQFYSSGMSARLAYAVAAHLNPDILLVDEVLAVGDFNFQRKCLNHMMGYLARGGSIILVSHAAHHVQAVCQRGLVLEKGRVAFQGGATEALDHYFAQQFGSGARSGPGRLTPTASRPAIIEGVTFTGPQGGPVEPDEEIRVQLTYNSLQALPGVAWSFLIYTNDGSICITGGYTTQALQLPAGRHTLHARILRCPLTAGDYLVRASIYDVNLIQPVAMLGWEDAPAQLSVQAPPSLEKNYQQIIRQLVTLEVEWTHLAAPQLT